MAGPCRFVIFGATGHLARTKLLPALYRLEAAGRLPIDFSVVCFGRRPYDNTSWRGLVVEMLQARYGERMDIDALERFAERLEYFRGDLAEADSYRRLRETVAADAVFYLAVKPAEFPAVAQNLAAAGLADESQGWRRLVVEKPFGRDLDSAEGLNRLLHSHFREEQIFRIDHYLGKETVQNVFVFRFANLIWEPLWNRNYIDHVQITHGELAGVEGRADFYDNTGALRDMVQSHLLQLLALVAMEPPAAMDAESVRDEKVKVLKSIRPIAKSEVASCAYRAQYAAAPGIPGFLQEPGVAAGSVTETYAALRLHIDNWRWRGVPFYIRTGKRMAANSAMIAVRFKQPPQQLFQSTGVGQEPNWLLMGIQPEQCLRAEVQVREPGLKLTTRRSQLDAGTCGCAAYHLEAYEALLLDVVEGDHSLFLRYDEVMWAWRVIEPVLEVWGLERDFIDTYAAGTWGPEDAGRLFEGEGRFWRNSLAG